MASGRHWSSFSGPWAGSVSFTVSGRGPRCAARSRSWSCWCWSSSWPSCPRSCRPWVTPREQRGCCRDAGGAGEGARWGGWTREKAVVGVRGEAQAGARAHHWGRAPRLYSTWHNPYSTRHNSVYSVANGHPAEPEIRMCLYFFPSPFRCPKIVSSVILPSSPTLIPFFSLSNTKLFLGLFWTKWGHAHKETTNLWNPLGDTMSPIQACRKAAAVGVEEAVLLQMKWQGGLWPHHVINLSF